MEKELTATEQLKRIAALPYNYYFLHEAQKIRKEYPIPVDNRETWNWFFNEHVGPENKAAWPLFEPNPLMLIKKAKTIYDTEVPLEKDIVLIMKQFQLPPYIFRFLLLYILFNDMRYLDPQNFTPDVDFEPDIRRGLPEWKATVTGIFPWTTQTEWNNIWTRLKQMDEFWDLSYEGDMRTVIETLKPATSTKRTTVESYSKQMKRDSEWYQLVGIEGLPIREALERWENEHPTEVEDYRSEHPKHPEFDESTVSKAVNRFRKIITPTPI